ncbi:hypothetical protein Cni_G27240 [Canna indica]|uniref:J domain-containing protein n=1 Tax=Canna indica TaxID=4628 RepID=A0AAQ3L144_9LILI|nr:hypothetical protein Cni_G27240 [Canna indica]
MALRQAREEETNAGKAQLVRQICSAASIFSRCTHRRRSSLSPAFVDWWLVLGVEEDDKVDAIRKRYRQLALQLHPDKNKHPDADLAFKIVSEAYTCLSDKAKRKAFNLVRENNFCKECYNTFHHSMDNNNDAMHKQRIACKSARQAWSNSSSRMINTWRQLQKRFRDECEVIESCLRANQAYWEESPLFDPYEHVGGASAALRETGPFQENILAIHHKFSLI